MSTEHFIQMNSFADIQYLGEIQQAHISLLVWATYQLTEVVFPEMLENPLFQQNLVKNVCFELSAKNY